MKRVLLSYYCLDCDNAWLEIALLDQQAECDYCKRKCVGEEIANENRQ